VRGITEGKNIDELFWEEKFHAANGKAQAYTQGALHFSLLSWERSGGWRRIFFSFPGSHYIPFKFPNSSQQFLKYAPQVLNVFPNMFSIAHHL